MADSLPDLIARLRLDVSDMQQGVGRVSAIGGAIGGAIGATIGPAIGAALGKIREFVSGSVSAFAELEDSTAAAGVVFGDSMGAIIEQSKTAASTLGLSSQQVINAANTFGTYGKSAGLAGDELARFSTDMTGLAGDLASFKGTTTEQAIEAIGSALRGEAEPIRAYGVLLDDATLKARAMAMGIGDGTAALTPQQKVLAAQAEILAQTTDAQGDFARTMDSTANVAKTFGAESENLQAKLGTVLAPAFTMVRAAATLMVRDLSGRLDEFLPRAEAFYTRLTAVMGGVRELFASGDITSGLLQGLGVEEDSPIIGMLLGVRTALEVTRGAFALFATGDITSGLLQALNVEEDAPIIDTLLGIRETVGEVLAGIGPVITEVFAAIGPVLGEVFGALGSSIGPLLPQIGALIAAFSPLGIVLQALAPVLPVLGGAIARIVTELAGALGGILPGLIGLGQIISGVVVSALVTLLPVVAQVAMVLAGALAGAVQSLAPVIVSLVPVAAQLATALGGVLATVVSALAPVVVMLAGVIAQLLPPVLGLIAPLLGIVQAVLPLIGVLGTLIGAILPPLIQLFMAVIGPVVELVGVLGAALVPVINLAAGIISGVLVPIITVLIGIVGAIIGVVLRFAGPVLGGLVGMLGTVIGWIVRVVGAIASWLGSLGGIGPAIGRMASAVGTGVASVVSWFTGLPGRVISALGSLGSSLFSAGGDLLQGMVNGVKAKVGAVVDAVKGAVGDAISGAKRLLGIASPSKVFDGIGRDTGAGLVRGLDASRRGVLGAAERMAAEVAGVTVPTPPIATTYGGTNTNPTGGALTGAGVQVRVWLGNEELTDRMRVEVVNVLEDEAVAIGYGSTD